MQRGYICFYGVASPLLRRRMTLVRGLEHMHIFLMGLAGQKWPETNIHIGSLESTINTPAAAACHHWFPYMDI